MTNAKDKLAVYTSNIKPVESNLEDIKTKLIETDLVVSELDLQSIFYVHDFDGSFCDYYRIERVNSNTVSLIPLWETEEGKVTSSGDSRSVITNLITVDNSNYQVICNVLEEKGYTLPDLDNLTVGDFWLIACYYGDLLVALGDNIDSTIINLSK